MTDNLTSSPPIDDVRRDRSRRQQTTGEPRNRIQIEYDSRTSRPRHRPNSADLQVPFVNRGDWIRTSDRPAPSRVRYQTAPLPVEDRFYEQSASHRPAGRQPSSTRAQGAR